jgi:AcrR family transcriptional regulator
MTRWQSLFSDAATQPRERKPLHILRAAKRLFSRTGGINFSVRGVAKEAGVSLGAVQHFYPTKEKLLIAMLQYVVGGYDQNYSRLLSRLPNDGEVRLLAVVDFLVSDIWRVETRQFFFAFWALGAHSRFAQRLRDKAYEYHCNGLAQFIAAARPRLTARRRAITAMQVAALIEGTMLFAKPSAGAVARKRRVREIQAAVLRIID